MELSFRHDTLPVDLFTQELREVCGHFTTRPTKGVGDVWGGVAIQEKMGLEMALVATDVQQVVRTARNIRADDGENYFLIVQQEGRAVMAQSERSAVLHPGDMVLIDSARPSEFTFFGDRSCQLSLHLPRIELEDLFGPNIPGGLSLERHDPMALAIHAIIAKSHAIDGGEVHLKDALMSIIGVFLSERNVSSHIRVAGMDPQENGILSQAIGYIEARHRDPEFTAGMIADDLGAAPHQIQRAFKTLGTTASKYLLARRLETAARMLKASGHSDQPALISTIAYDCGFSDISYFNRRFREVFGCAPGAYR